MFISLEQPRIILICLFFGVILGVYLEPFLFISKFFKRRVWKEVIRWIAIASYSIIFTFLSSLYYLPNFRLYMALCVVVGATLYKFSFHKAVAILSSRVYNVIKITFLRVKLSNERRKEKARLFRGAKRNDNARNDFSGNINLSTRGHNNAKKQNKTVRRGNRLSARTD